MVKTKSQHPFLDLIGQLPAYEKRPTQLAMVKTIEKALKKQKHAVIEAGTGSGKSFAYLFPALNHGHKVVIATATIALQEQILYKDIPFLAQHLNRPIQAMLAKGRSNYIAWQKSWALERELPPIGESRAELSQIMAEMHDWDGDFANLSFEPTPALKQELASTSEDCLGKNCEFFNTCAYFKARRNLHEADVIVTNHALYFTDLATGAGILPPHDVVIFDEAHHLPKTATAAFSASVGRYALTRLLQKIERRLQPIPHALRDRLLSDESSLLQWLLQMGKPTLRLQQEPVWQALLQSLIQGMKSLSLWLQQLNPERLHLPHLGVQSKSRFYKENVLAQTENLRDRLTYFLSGDDERVHWADLNFNSLYYELHSAPVVIADLLTSHLWPHRTAILTSATLTINGSCEYLAGQLGLKDYNQAIYPSPFDFYNQGALYIPPDLPEPNTHEFIPAILPVIQDILQVTQGRAFVLFASWSNMRQVAEQLFPSLPFPCYKQGDLPKARLVEWFTQTPQAVLLATATFWEGIDIQGEQLSCVIIDRIPFAVPDDPMVAATVSRYKQEGRNWFQDYMLPEAIMRLQQGVGRLIRSHSDRGLVVLLDSRVYRKSYGSKILKALPDFQQIQALEEAIDFLTPYEENPLGCLGTVSQMGWFTPSTPPQVGH